MRYDIDNDINETVFIKWYDYALELGMKDETYLSYENWCAITLNGSIDLPERLHPPENTKAPETLKDAVRSLKILPR